jgi:hypothetical protein
MTYKAIVVVRDRKAVTQRLRRTNFRSQKTLEGFDFSRLSNLNRSLIHDLRPVALSEKRSPC